MPIATRMDQEDEHAGADNARKKKLKPHEKMFIERNIVDMLFSVDLARLDAE